MAGSAIVPEPVSCCRLYSEIERAIILLLNTSQPFILLTKQPIEKSKLLDMAGCGTIEQHNFLSAKTETMH